MFTKFKQAIEKWLRGIINEEVAAEVSKIDTSLNAERTAFCNLTKAAECTLNTSLVRLSNISHFVENQALRDHIRNLESGVTEVSDLVKKLHPSLKV